METEFLQIAIQASVEAGKEILAIYQKEDVGVEYKADDSPLTLADKKAHQTISGILEKTGLPVLSEEGKGIAKLERQQWPRFWMVDPLDGTKEFINRNGEFTVNIALMEQNVPVSGVVLVPALDIIYFGSLEQGAYVYKGILQDQAGTGLSDLMTKAEKLPLKKEDNVIRVVSSRSHSNEETRKLLEKIQSNFNKVELVSKGSALKLCLVAEGRADVYPRLGNTMEWDIAAGHALLNAVGAKLFEVEGDDFTYNKDDLLNPPFIAYSAYSFSSIEPIINS